MGDGGLMMKIGHSRIRGGGDGVGVMRIIFFNQVILLHVGAFSKSLDINQELCPPFLPASLAASLPFSKLPLLALPPCEAMSCYIDHHRQRPLPATKATFKGNKSRLGRSGV